MLNAIDFPEIMKPTLSGIYKKCWIKAGVCTLSTMYIGSWYMVLDNDISLWQLIRGQ